MDTLDDHIQKSSNIFDSQEVLSSAQKFGKWGTFLSILQFIGSGFIFIAAIFMILGGAFDGTAYGAGFGLGMAFVYIIIGVLSILPAIRFYRASRSALDAARMRDGKIATEALKNLASGVQILGIYAIIYIGFIVLFMLFGMGAALASF